MIKLSRSKIELFLRCPRCFWLYTKQKIKRPPPAPYTINNAIDYLFKQDFDVHRENGTQHPIMSAHKIDAVPFQHSNMSKWRHNFTGVQFEHKLTDCLIFGAVDDVWVTPKDELIIVDYKATGANQHKIYDSYGRQMEIYQWLFKQNGFKVSVSGYFVFARVNKGSGFSESFEKGVLPFDIFVEEYKGDDSWVEEAIISAKKTYDMETAPKANEDCEYCIYRGRVAALTN
jgi:uncharacterized C2H2 Zn-finger protein